MTHGRLLRLLLYCLPGLSFSALAVDHIDIHIGQLQYEGAEIENLSATLDMQGRWQGNATLKQGDLAGFSKQLPLPVGISKGSVKGIAAFSGENKVFQRIKSEADVRDVAFSDAEGLHAGEKISGHAAVNAERSGSGWNWSGALDWKAGEVFWQPFYIAKGGVSFQGKGKVDDDLLTLSEGKLALVDIGESAISGTFHRRDSKLQSLDFDARNLDAASTYPLLIKPLMDKTLLGNLDMAGRADVRASLVDGALSSFEVALRDFDVADKDGHFAFYKADAHVPWALNKPTQATLRYESGQVLNMPLGKADLTAMLDGYSLTAPVLLMPVLDGELALKDISAALLQNQWHGHLSATLTPVSMADFSHAVGWPTMQGKVAMSIPLVTYSNGQLTTDGALGFDVFDGSVVVRNLAMQNPLSTVPRLQGDIQMRNLDLELLTRTFSFGAMTGRLDGDVNGMELSRWQPVKFDADVHSSPGSYPKKISQRAVENISALGGAGAAAAIQRSFLQFFKEFNYGKIGLSCRLRNGVCTMRGAEDTPGGYVIVKGSGIPAITVMGYNRSVSWGELLERVKRVTSGNASPVIK